LTYFNGALFGTTVSGGSRDQGTIFSLSTSGEDYNAQSFSRNNGRDPWGGFNSWGYGTTFRGGKLRRGNVYELACCGRIYVKHTFNLTSKAGIYPMGDLITQNADGALRMYGTTFLGGDGGQGTVYQLRARETKYGAWAISVLHSFSGSDGANPSAGVVLDSAGNLYGTTTWGGTEAGYAGTVFKLTPGPKNQWTHTVLYSFTGGIDGDAVYSGVVLDNAGNLYGTTFLGGAFNKGVVYEVTP
jgi:uncharacterized repeat protein (TIGR03803 family)